MSKMDRRSFIRAGVTLGAGAALGSLATVGVKSGFRDCGPSVLKTRFFNTDLLIPARLFTVERRNIFGIALFASNGKEDGQVQFKLSEMREAVRLRHGVVDFKALKGDGSSTPLQARVQVDERWTFFTLKDESIFWMDLADLERAL